MALNVTSFVPDQETCFNPDKPSYEAADPDGKHLNIQFTQSHLILVKNETASDGRSCFMTTLAVPWILVTEVHFSRFKKTALTFVLSERFLRRPCPTANYINFGFSIRGRFRVTEMRHRKVFKTALLTWRIYTQEYQTWKKAVLYNCTTSHASLDGRAEEAQEAQEGGHINLAFEESP